MAEWDPFQVDFTGGEINPKMINSLDTEVYRKSVLQMYNWMPAIEGPAQRVPGSLFIEELVAADDKARVIPYLNINNDRALVVLSDQSVRIVAGLGGSEEIASTTGFRKQIVTNPEFAASQAGWNFEPPRFTSKDGANLGCWYIGTGNLGSMQVISRTWKFPNIDNFQAIVDQETEVDVPTDFITLSYRILYTQNPGFDPDNPDIDPDDEYDAFLYVGTTPGGNDLFNRQLNGPPGSVFEEVLNINLPTAGWTGPVYIQFFNRGTAFASTPTHQIDRISILADAVAPPADEVVTSPYTADELDAIQFVQSPYDDKPLVLVHPNHIPHWLFFDTSLPTPAYVLQPVPFVSPPSFWAVDNYPSACTAYQGRLVLAGTPLESETVVASKPGNWADFTVSTPVVADDALEFTTIFRGPTQWIGSQKDLVVGADIFEYVVVAENGILQPGDIDTRLHSTHGSTPVQPVGMGDYLAFAGEGGTRLRAAQRNRDRAGWIAIDKTLMASHLTVSGIKRMVRMRNPHQMIICVLGNGRMAIMHEEPYAGILGWSEYDLGGEVIDIAAQATDSGLDILYVLVRRQVARVGDRRALCLEAVVDWSDVSTWRHLSSYRLYNFDTPTTTLGGLGHLQGSRVEVVGDGNFLGQFTVGIDTIEIDTPVITAYVGVSMYNYLQTLPPEVPAVVGGLGSKKRYSEVIVRTLGSTRPIINGNIFTGTVEGSEPPARDPSTPMGRSQSVDLINDNKVTNLGWGPAETIVVEEPSPFPCNVVAIHGKLASKNI